MGDISIRVNGEKELRAALRQAGGPDLVRALSGAHRDAATVVAAAARTSAPARSGRLRSSIRPLASQQSGRVRAGSAAVVYAPAIHWGRKIGNVGSPPGNHPGRNMIVGRPFLTDALARSRPKVLTVFDRAIGQIVKNVSTKG